MRNALKAESSLLKLEYKTYVLGLNRKKEPAMEFSQMILRRGWRIGDLVKPILKYCTIILF